MGGSSGSGGSSISSCRSSSNNGRVEDKMAATSNSTNLVDILLVCKKYSS